MEAIGVRWAFRVCSVFAIVTCIVYAIAQRFMPPVRIIHETDGDTKEKVVNNNKTYDVKDELEMEKGDEGDNLADDNTTMTKA